MHCQGEGKDISHLDYTEKNALRYAAGFVIRSLQKKIDRSTHCLKEACKTLPEGIREDSGKIIIIIV